MDILKYKEYEGTAELDMTRGLCRGKVLFIDDLVTYETDSPRELQREFELAVDDYIATCTTLGKEPQRPFRGLFNVRIPPELHRAAALRATSDTVSLNDVVVRALDGFLNFRADVNHTIKVTLESPQGAVQTIRAAASKKAQWAKRGITHHVH